FAIPLRTRDFRTIQTTGDIHLDAQRTEAHRVADGALHGATEHDAAFQLLRDRFGDQLRVKLGLAHFGDVDVHRDAHHLADLQAQLFDVLALLANHHARPGGVDGDTRGLCRTLDLDAGDTRLLQILAQHLANLQVRSEVLGVLTLAGIPLRVPILGDAKTNPGRMNFMTHRTFPVTCPCPRPR